MSSRCDSPTRKKWNEPLFTPTDIRRTTLPAVVSSRPTLRERRPHPVGGGGGPRGMPGAREPEQQRVAAELQQAAVLAVGDGEQPGEDGAEDLGDLLGAHLAVAGQALGHLREPGDVDEDHRPLERSEREVRLFGEPADQQPGSVRPQDLRALGRAPAPRTVPPPAGLRVYAAAPSAGGATRVAARLARRAACRLRCSEMPDPDDDLSPTLAETARRRADLRDALVDVEQATSRPAVGREPEWTEGGPAPARGARARDRRAHRDHGADRGPVRRDLDQGAAPGDEDRPAPRGAPRPARAHQGARRQAPDHARSARRGRCDEARDDLQRLARTDRAPPPARIRSRLGGVQPRHRRDRVARPAAV